MHKSRAVRRLYRVTVRQYTPDGDKYEVGVNPSIITTIHLSDIRNHGMDIKIGWYISVVVFSLVAFA